MKTIRQIVQEEISKINENFGFDFFDESTKNKIQRLMNYIDEFQFKLNSLIEGTFTNGEQFESDKSEMLNKIKILKKFMKDMNSNVISELSQVEEKVNLMTKYQSTIAKVK